MFGALPTLPNYQVYQTSYGVGEETLKTQQSIRSLCNGNQLSFFLIDDEQKFNMLASTWERNTRMMSSSSDMFLNESYLNIIGMGEKALPFIFLEMQKEPNHWFLALKSITGVDPVLPVDRGNIAKMTETWIKWGKDNNYA